LKPLHRISNLGLACVNGTRSQEKISQSFDSINYVVVFNITQPKKSSAVHGFAAKFFKKISSLSPSCASDNAVARAMYQPYSLSKYFNCKGEFQAFFNSWQLLHHSLEYGHKPMALQFDQDEDRKL
jgi:hypothetical protein